jgi:hypothetical protein
MADLPRRISDYSSGWGYGLTVYPNGTYNYDAYMSFAWDFDLNCAWSYAQSYEDYSWVETSMCKGQVNQYYSDYGCYNYNDNTNIEGVYNYWFKGLVFDHGYDSDPVWGFGNYSVREHKSDDVLVYQNAYSGAIEYIVEYSYDGDYVLYFPSGLTEY